MPAEPKPAQNLSQACRYPLAPTATGSAISRRAIGGAPTTTRIASRAIAATTPVWPARRRRAISAGPMLHTPGTYSEDATGMGLGAPVAAKVDGVMGLAGCGVGEGPCYCG